MFMHLTCFLTVAHFLTDSSLILTQTTCNNVPRTKAVRLGGRQLIAPSRKKNETRYTSELRQFAAATMESISDEMRRSNQAALQRSLQRELADSLIRCAPLDDIRVLLACGAQVNEPVAQGLRPIHYAIYQQYQLAVELLLVRGCQVDAMDDVGYTALHLCAEKGFLELAQLLISYGARVCFTDVDTEGRSYYGNPPRQTMADEPLRIAIRNDHFELAELLLKHGANPNARYAIVFVTGARSRARSAPARPWQGTRPCRRPSQAGGRNNGHCTTRSVCRSRSPPTAFKADWRRGRKGLCVGHALAIDQTPSRHRDAVTLDAVASAFVAVVARSSTAHPNWSVLALNHSRGKRRRRRPSVFSCERRQGPVTGGRRHEEVEMMKDLDRTGPPLSKDRAAAEVGPAMLEGRAEVMDESTAADRCPREGQEEMEQRGARRSWVMLYRPPWFPLHRYFLGAEINLISPLALSYMKLLLRFGADANSKDRTGLTPLMKACRHPQGYDAVELLVKFGADVNAMAGERHDYRSVLHYAVLSSNVDTVKFILSKGARVNMEISYRYPSPLDFAVLR
ncbi:ankyrin-1-like [Tropilaelaps mercedesae]|uniref:Alpha-latrotoxin n=1 Tax=Tropilaelaps mercedesae TaxID=418985 RepID=A0A1V9XS29_9ACAR|nr:ankyrin-1-like [Tropilaelaps mercedesae]